MQYNDIRITNQIDMFEARPPEVCESGPDSVPSTNPHITRFVNEGIFAAICQLFNPCLDLVDPELNDPEAYREVPERVVIDRHALASLAQTCRAVSESALNALWRRLDSPEPLLRLLLAVMRRVPADTPQLTQDHFEAQTTVRRLRSSTCFLVMTTIFADIPTPAAAGATWPLQPVCQTSRESEYPQGDYDTLVSILPSGHGMRRTHERPPAARAQ